MKSKAKIDCLDFTLSDVGLLVGELADQEIQMDQLTAKMNAELDAVRARFEEKLQNLRGNVNVRREALAQWADAHKDFFQQKRSMEFERGTIGFRTGMPKLKTLSRVTWEIVKTRLLNNGPLGYTRTEVTVAKDLLIADAEKLGESALKDIGVKVVQEDSFFCEIKKDEQVNLPAEARAQKSA